MSDPQSWVELALQIIGVASIIASFTPTKKDDAAVLFLRKLINILAFNVGKAKPKD